MVTTADNYIPPEIIQQIHTREAKLFNSKKKRYQFIDLFAGAGGFHLALKKVEAEGVFASEWDEKARITYELNHQREENPFRFAGDITAVIPADIPNHDILCGGFPCQPFSIAGTQMGFEHTQGTLFFNILQIIDAKRPKVVFLENVKNLVSHDDGNTFRKLSRRVLVSFLKSDVPAFILREDLKPK